MSKERSKKPGPAVIPVRMPGDMQARVKNVSKMSRLSDADVMRMALERGLPALEKMFGQPTPVAA